jgi:DNA-directed RNA polymerase specialized sigma24 family protein
VLPELDVMYRVALAITRNHADAEDVVQDALLRAYRGHRWLRRPLIPEPGC